MALADLTRLYAQQNQQPWQQQLYGPQQIIFNPEQTNMAGLNSSTTTDNTDSNKLGGNGTGNSKDSERMAYDKSDPANKDRAYIDDPDYWAGQFDPTLSWKDTMKAYGPYMGMGLINPVQAGFAMAKQYMNPTDDPVWQKAAQEFLATNGSNMPLSELTKQIGMLYKADPLNSGVFATDTAMGVLQSQGPLGQLYNTMLQTGYQPYEFNQFANGLNAMGVNPTVDMPDLAQMPHLVSNVRGINSGNYSTGGPVAQAVQRGIQHSQERASSRQWMDDVLSGKTTSAYKDYSAENGRDDYGGDWGDDDRNRNGDQIGQGR